MGFVSYIIYHYERPELHSQLITEFTHTAEGHVEIINLRDLTHELKLNTTKSL